MVTGSTEEAWMATEVVEAAAEKLGTVEVELAAEATAVASPAVGASVEEVTVVAASEEVELAAVGLAVASVAEASAAEVMAVEASAAAAMAAADLEVAGVVVAAEVAEGTAMEAAVARKLGEVDLATAVVEVAEAAPAVMVEVVPAQAIPGEAASVEPTAAAVVAACTAPSRQQTAGCDPCTRRCQTPRTSRRLFRPAGGRRT
jgi:hypothetical protein